MSHTPEEQRSAVFRLLDRAPLRSMAVAALILLAARQPARANDSAFGGVGSDLMPLSTPEVEMVQEHIVIRTTEDRSGLRVQVRFEFKNTTDRPVTLQMGFPFALPELEQDIQRPPRADGSGKRHRVRKDEPLVWEFQTFLRGKEVKSTRKAVQPNPQLEPDHHYAFAYVWPVSFSPGETVTVENRYLLGTTIDSMGHVMVPYVLKTGGLWHGGRIGRSRIDVYGVPGLVPCFGEWLYEQTLPAGYALKAHEDRSLSLHWNLGDHRPTEDLAVCFLDQEQAMQSLMHEWIEKVPEQSDWDLRLLRNAAYALAGARFKDEALQARFSMMPWYLPLPAGEQRPAPNEAQRALIEAVNAELTRRRAAQDSPEQP